MDWIREWIWHIVGVIVLSAVADMIMPGGEMKKYVRLILGLVLVVAFIRPVTNLPSVSLAEIERAETQKKAIELKNRLSEREQFNVVKIYKEKLCQSIEDKLTLPDDVDAEVKVNVETENDREFGNVTDVTVVLYSDREIEGISEQVSESVKDGFGIPIEDIRVVMLNKG